MAQGVHKITEDFEKALCDYTGAPYAIALDNMSNALFLALYYEKNIIKSLTGDTVDCPSKTYPSVPCEIIHAGLKVNFTPVEGDMIKGPYRLFPSNVVDSALRFTSDMYVSGTHMCLSKGGAIITDDYQAMLWFKRARFSGRRECSYHDDNFDMLGWNFYMMPELAARGLLMMTQFYDLKGKKKHMEDLELPYPDLSKYEIYKK